MRKVASAENPMQAHLIVAMLEEQGIEAIVQGEALWGARGELPLTSESAPSVWVADDVQAVRARELIAEREGHVAVRTCYSCGHEVRGLDDETCPKCGASMKAQPARSCPTCGEPMETPFVRCWKCAAAGPSDPPLRAGGIARSFAAGASDEELARLARPDCRHCGGGGVETRVLLPATLFFIAAICWLAAATGVNLSRFPQINWPRMPIATVQILLGVIAVVVAFKYRTRPCDCVMGQDRLEDPA